MITNITTDPLEVAKAAGLYAVVDSGGKANVVSAAVDFVF